MSEIISSLTNTNFGTRYKRPQYDVCATVSSCEITLCQWQLLAECHIKTLWQHWHSYMTPSHTVWQQSDWQSVMPTVLLRHCQLSATEQYRSVGCRDRIDTLLSHCHTLFGSRVMDNPRWCQLYCRGTVNCQQHNNMTVSVEILNAT